MYTDLLNKESIYIPKEINRTGIILKGEDLLVLLQIYIHSTMRSTSIHEIYQWTYPKEVERNSKWISNRLKKLAGAGLVEQLRENITARKLQALVCYHYRLDNLGFEVLVNEGLVDSEDARKLMMYSKRKNFPTVHTRAASYLANATLIELLGKEKYEGFSHIRGSRHLYLGVSKEEIEVEQKGVIVPDWVFERNDTIVAMEVDTGSQSRENIMRKYYRYEKVANYYLTLGKKLIVLFSTTDSSVTEFSIGRDANRENRERRIGSLKEWIPLQSKWPDNLHIYVATAKRIPKLVAKFLSNQEPAEQMDKMLDVNTWFDLMMNRLPTNKKMMVEELDKVLLPNRNRQLDAEYVFQLKQGGFSKERHLVLYGEEGSVRSYQTIRNNAHLAYQYNANPKERIPLKVDVIYGDKESAQEDVYGHDIYQSIYFGDLASAKEGEILPEQIILTQKLISPFKKEEVGIFT